jgi:hypothetical protein
MTQAQTSSALTCPSCAQPLINYAINCSNCGLDLLANDPRSPEVLAKSINRNDQSVFFYVSPLKLVVMSLVTFGLYEIFWHYKYWTYVKEHGGRKVWPAARAVFRFFTYYALMQEVQQAGHNQQQHNRRLPAVPLAVLYILLNLTWRLPGPLAFIGSLMPLVLVPTQQYVNALNAKSPTPINNRFTPLNWVAIVIGLILQLLSVAGSFMPDNRG